MAFKIADRAIDGGQSTFVIAEIGQAHEGSLGMAYAFVDAAAAAGADAVKFQTHIAASESTLDEPFRIAMSGQDATRYDYWKRMEFTPEQWEGLAAHARDEGLVFLSSAFSVEAVTLLDAIGMPAWKVGSGEVFNTRLLDAMAATGKPVLMSTGMSSYDEIEQGYRHLEERDLDVALFQCTSKYPTELAAVGLNVIDELRARFRCPVGLSDHSGTVYPALAAMAREVDLLELHVTFDRRMYGPDSSASLTFEELAHVTAANRAFAEMRENPVDKDALAAEMEDMRALFTKSVGLTRAAEVGTVLSADILTLKKPGTGISANRIDELIGRRLVRPVSPEWLLRWTDLES